LVGRVREREVLSSVVAGNGRGARAVVVAGEAGIGRTSLLASVATSAERRTVWIRGGEAESGLPYAAAVDLLVPLWRYTEHLPVARQVAVETVLALRPGVVDPLAACVAVLAVLTAAAADAPLLIVVDDLQWVDPESRRILLYAARRLSLPSAAVLFSYRDQPGGRLTADLPELRLEGLDQTECHELVAALPVEVSPQVEEQIAAQTGGNPSAVIETVTATPAHLLAGPAEAFPGSRPGPALQHAWSAAVESLPEATRMALAVLATIGPAQLEELEPVLAALGAELSDLDAAEQAGLLRTRHGTVSLRHPLLPAAVIACTPPAARRRVVLALAVHVDGDLRSWSRAVALTGADDAIADGLDDATATARSRGGHLAAGRVGEQAAALTSDPGRRAARLHAAAVDALLGGAAEQARRWCDDGLALQPDPGPAADLALVRGRAHAWLGHPAHAADDLVRAADAVRGDDAGRAARLYAEAAPAFGIVGRIAEGVRAAECAAAQPGAPERFSVAVAAASALLQAGRTAQARDRAVVAERLAPAADPRGHGHHLVLLAQVLARLERPVAAQGLLGAVLDATRRAGVSAVQAFALVARADLDLSRGEWAAARADLVEGLRRAEELGQVPVIGLALVALARLDAVCGGPEEARRWAERAREEVGPYGIASLRVAVPAALGLAALTAGDPEAAVTQLDQASRAASAQGLGAVPVATLAADLAEAQIRRGEPSRAEEALARLDEAAEDGLAQPAAAAARCRGMLAEDLDTAQGHFADARSWHGAHPVPFERARTLLCEGEVLRRLRRPALARPVLREAGALFTELGAAPWAVRSAAEVAAAGGSGRGRGAAGPGRAGAAYARRLSAQELQVATRVAEGRNNAEVAAALFVSRKTVEAHLTRIYRKLGVRSRTELVRLLAPVLEPDPASDEAELSTPRV
jgi:DNA-binding CsgD family transcriptional regulator